MTTPSRAKMENDVVASTSPRPTRGVALNVMSRFTLLDAAMLGLLALLVVCHVVAALLAAGWRTAALTDALGTLYVALLAARRAWRPLLLRLMLLGFVAGLLELATDAAGERVAHSLSYPPGEPLLWSSPVYMPLAWMLVLSLLAYLGARLRSLAPRLPLWGTLALTGLAGALLVPLFEETAWYAGWWRYAPTRLLLGHVPAYVILFEGLIAATLPLLVVGLSRLPWRFVALRGLALGVWMPVAALVAWLALGLW